MIKVYVFCLLLLCGGNFCDYSANLRVRRLATSRDGNLLQVGFTTTPDYCRGNYALFHGKIYASNATAKYMYEMLEKSFLDGTKVDIWYAAGTDAYNRRYQECNTMATLVEIGGVGYSTE